MTQETKTQDSPDDRKGRFAAAFADYRALLLLGLAFMIVVCVEAYIYGVPVGDMLGLLGATYNVIAKMLVLMMFSAVFYFCRRLFDGKEKRAGRGRIVHAWHGLNAKAESYLSGRLFAYGLVGLAAVLPLDFFFIQKALQPVINPYSWDPVFARWDRIVHFGHAPNDVAVAVAKHVDFLGTLLDLSYLAWFGVMFSVLFFNLMVDRDLKRRLRYLWVFILSWLVVGSLLADMLSSVGPVFYHVFYPMLPDPYEAMRAYVEKNGAADFPVAFMSRGFLIRWATNGRLINPNVMSAMPSMHMAVAWLNVLYGFRVNRWLGLFTGVFALMIYGATMLFGFHYGLDIYASVVVVSIMWWISGRIANRKYGKNETPRLVT